MNEQASTYKNHRFPISIVARAVWLYFRFNLSLREVEEMMLERGVEVSYETIRRWCRSHGSLLTVRLRRKTPSVSDVWLLDEVVVSIGGKKYWLCRAIDQDGYVLDEIVQTCRNPRQQSVCWLGFSRSKACAPKRIGADKLRSYGAAKRQLMTNVEHRSHKGLNNRAENSHLPFRKRERTRQGFRSIGSLQHFVSIFSVTRNHFVQANSIRSAGLIRAHRKTAIAEWKATAHKLV